MDKSEEHIRQVVAYLVSHGLIGLYKISAHQPLPSIQEEDPVPAIDIALEDIGCDFFVYAGVAEKQRGNIVELVTAIPDFYFVRLTKDRKKIEEIKHDLLPQEVRLASLGNPEAVDFIDNKLVYAAAPESLDRFAAAVKRQDRLAQEAETPKTVYQLLTSSLQN